MLTAADVRSARFTATKFRSGYEILEVDALLARAARTLEHLEQGLTVESDGTPLLTPDDLLTARFSPTDLTEGYFVDEVDDLLDAIIDTLNTYIGRAERGEPLVQPASLGEDAGGAVAPEDAVENVSVIAGDEAAGTEPDAPADDTFGLAAWAAAEQPPAHDVVDTFADSDALAAEPLADEPSAAEPLTDEPTAADALDVPDEPATSDPFAAAPVWSPPASTDVTPSAWDTPVDTPQEPDVTGLDVRGLDVTGLDEELVDEFAPTGTHAVDAALDDGPAVTEDDWLQPSEQSSPWAPPEPVRWTAPETEDEIDLSSAAASETTPVADQAVAEPLAAPADQAVTEPVAAPADQAVTEPLAAPADQAVTEPVADPAVTAFLDDVLAAPAGEADGTSTDAPAPWEPGFVAPATPVPTPDWGFNAAAADEPDEWSAGSSDPAVDDPAVDNLAGAASATLPATPIEPADESADEGADPADDESSLLASTDESPWASLDGDEPVALDLDSEVRDAESADAELPAWLTDAQPEMASPSTPAPVALAEVAEEPAADVPTRVSAFAFAAQTSEEDLDAPTVLMEAVPEDHLPVVDELRHDALDEPQPAPGTDPVTLASAPVAAPTFDAPAASVETLAAPAGSAPYVAPAEALDSQGFLRQLTFARATSTGAAKDSITLVGPDGRVFSAVSVRKTPEGLVVDLG